MLQCGPRFYSQITSYPLKRGSEEIPNKRAVLSRLFLIKLGASCSGFGEVGLVVSSARQSMKLWMPFIDPGEIILIEHL